MKRGTSFRISDEGLRLLAELAKSMGISQASVLEIAIRLLAKREGVE